MINSVFSLVLVAIASHSKRANGAVTAGGAATEFEALCNVVRLAAPTVTMPTAADTNWPVLEKIAKINMTVADKEWQQIFRKKGESKAYHDAPPSELKPNADWQEKWSLWKDAVEAADRGTEDADIKEMELDKLDERQRTLLRPHIIPIAEAAVTLTRNLAQDTVEGDKLTANEATATLLDAVYGEHPKAATVKFEKIFVAKPANNGRQAACEFGTTENRVRTVAATLACICYKDNAAGANQLCKREQAAETWTDAGATMTPVHIDNILALCGKPSTDPLTSEAVQDALQSIRSKITTKASDGYLGPFISGCSGEKDAGACVKITGYKDAADSKGQAIPWVGPLLILQQRLAIREKRIKEAEQINNQLNVELAKAIATRYAVKHTQAVLTTTVQQQKKEVNQHTAGCHLKNKTIEECPEADCNYDSEKKECKPKETGTENQAAGTGGNGAAGGTATPAGCARHGSDKAACENDKTGDKQNCAWRKGKDGEDDKETEKCRNGSFIVNKKLALIAVAFVSLLKF
uniref:Variant surface glycoprotein 375 n=1 Tax=Trypanosoma brucei TaxID=5691 RepID=M4SZX8_9TRYP|nr:variant surface glycoprotein 375 [Trypanosoma brucei]